jgi:hypothetical protein
VPPDYAGVAEFAKRWSAYEENRVGRPWHLSINRHSLLILPTDKTVALTRGALQASAIFNCYNTAIVANKSCSKRPPKSGSMPGLSAAGRSAASKRFSGCQAPVMTKQHFVPTIVAYGAPPKGQLFVAAHQALRGPVSNLGRDLPIAGQSSTSAVPATLVQRIGAAPPPYSVRAAVAQHFLSCGT